MERSIVAKETPRNQHFISASFPCKGLICRCFDMRITWFWLLIWDGSTSGNVCHTEVSYSAKFRAFIIKRTILALNSRTIMDFFPIVIVKPPRYVQQNLGFLVQSPLV